MKHIYETPTMKEVIFAPADVIITSGLQSGGAGDEWIDDWDTHPDELKFNG